MGAECFVEQEMQAFLAQPTQPENSGPSSPIFFSKWSPTPSNRGIYSITLLINMGEEEKKKTFPKMQPGPRANSKDFTLPSNHPQILLNRN